MIGFPPEVRNLFVTNGSLGDNMGEDGHRFLPRNITSCKCVQDRAEETVHGEMVFRAVWW